MHSGKRNKPKWWQLYATLPLLVGLFLLEMQLPFTSTEHILAQVGILFLIYGFIHAWMRANQRVLMGLDEERGEWRVRVYEIPPAELVSPSSNQKAHRERHLVQLPKAGVKGLLDTTFEMEQPEAEPTVLTETDLLFFNTKDTRDTKV